SSPEICSLMIMLSGWFLPWFLLQTLRLSRRGLRVYSMKRTRKKGRWKKNSTSLAYPALFRRRGRGMQPPCAVLGAAGVVDCLIGAVIDGNGLLVFAAIQPFLVHIEVLRHDAAGNAGLRVLPRGRKAGCARFQRFG